MSKEIVILGGSYAGLGVSHQILKHVLPTLSSPSSYHVTLVDRDAKWMARVGAPRGIVSEKELPLDKLFYDIQEGFASYHKEQFTFEQATVTSLDHSARTVTLQYPHGSSKTLSYYALVIATGASPTTPLLGSVTAGHESSVKAIEEFRGALSSAKSIVIAGGGPAGIEAAGELGEALNGKAGFLSARPNVVKTKITVVTSDEKILPILRPALATKATKMLAKRGVDVITGVKVLSTEPPNAGELGSVLSATNVTLSNGETLQADLYIPAMGTKANTSFLPADLLDQRSLVDANGSTLRVDKAGPRVYAVGDVSNAGRGGILEILDTVPVLVGNLKRDLHLAASADSSLGEKNGGTNGAATNGATTGTIPAGVKAPERTWVRKDQESQLVPIGHGGGVGAFFGWKLPSFMVWAIKGRDYMVGRAAASVNGSDWAKEK